MEEMTEQIESAIQVYFDKEGIKDNMRVSIFKKSSMLWDVTVFTDTLLSAEAMHRVNAFVFFTVPFGVMHEVTNKLFNKVDIVTPGAHPAFNPNTSVTMAAINEKGEIVPIPIQDAKKSRNKNK